MENFICTTCGVQYADSENPPPVCTICSDERQYVNWQGQAWTHREEMFNTYSNTIRQLEPNLYGISIEPRFGIGQRALLIRSSEGNLLWDCLPMLDAATRGFMDQLGGLKAIALSHPHFYGAVVDWSRAFGDVPVFIHASDRQWHMRPAPQIHFWEGDEFPLGDEIKIVHCGGHFPGSSVLHYPQGAGGRGALFASDTMHVTTDRKFVSFMKSYPNFIPLSEKKVRHIWERAKRLKFNRIYGGFFDRNIKSGAKEACERSVNRYLWAIRD